MPFIRKFTYSLLLLFALISAKAQELNFTVSINAEIVQQTDRSIFSEMENAFEQFLNSRRWTNDSYQNNERIKANLILTIQDQPSIGFFTANAQIQVIRPVYNTSYETLLLNFADRDWEFAYTTSQPLEFSETRFITNLSSLLSFYAYIAIGVDYDSFSPLGGTQYLQRALTVVNNAQQGGRSGWGQFENNRNRYWLIENLILNAQYQPVRQASYKYHLEGLDVFDKQPEEARQSILQAIRDIQQVNQVLPNAILIRSFMDAKTDEIIQIFSQGQIKTRRDTYNELLKLDPTRSSKYQQLINN